MEYQTKNLLVRLSYYLIALAVLALLVFGIYSAVKSSELTVPVPLASVVTNNDWQKGNQEASVTLVEYADFQCPACGQFDPLLAQLISVYGDRVDFVYRNFPLREKHANAEAAAEAAGAAGLQGKFWEMHNVLYANQTSWQDLADPKVTFQGYAKSLGLDMDKFNADSGSVAVRDRIEADYRSGLAAGIDGTPTFFLQGVKIANPASYNAFAAVIESALAKTAQAPTTTP